MNRIIKGLIEAFPNKKDAILSMFETEKAKGITSVQAAKAVAEVMAYTESVKEIDGIILRVYDTKKGRRIAVLYDREIITGGIAEDVPEMKLKTGHLKMITRKNVLSGAETIVFEIVGEPKPLNIEELIANSATDVQGDYVILLAEIQRIVGWGEPEDWITPEGLHLRMNIRTTNGEWLTVFLREWEQIVSLIPPDLREELASLKDNEEIMEFVNGELAYDKDMRTPGAQIVISGRVKREIYVSNSGEERESLQLSLMPASIMENLELLRDEGEVVVGEKPSASTSSDYPNVEEVFEKYGDCMSKFDFAVRFGESAEKALHYYLERGMIYEKDSNTICIVK